MSFGFKKITLQTKLFMSFALTSAFVMLVGGFSYYFGQRTISDYRKIALKGLPSTVITENLRGLAKDLRSSVNRMAASDNSVDELQALSDKINTYKSQYKEAELEYSALNFENDEKVLFDKAGSLWVQFSDQAKIISDARLLGTPEGFKQYSELLRGDFRASANAYFESINELAAYHQKKARLDREDAEKTEKIGNQLSFGTMLFCFLFSIIAGVLSRKEVSNLIVKISESLKVSVTMVGEFANSVNQISYDLTNSSQHQAAAIQETTAAVTEISSTLDKTTTGTFRAQQLAQEAQGEVENGKKAIDHLNEGIHHLRDTIFTMVDQVTENNKSFDSLVGVINEIENKTKVINEIVFQTKLLSFNASVEAARAGEAGKGFAVVAEEVGNLAKLSGVASKEISTLLANSIKTVQEIVANYKNSMGHVIEDIKDQHVEVTERIKVCEASFVDIHKTSVDVFKNMEAIQAATGEQNIGMQEISKAMHDISSVTDENVSNSMKASTTAAELQNQVIILESAIESLKLGLFDDDANSNKLVQQNKSDQQNQNQNSNQNLKNARAEIDNQNQSVA